MGNRNSQVAGAGGDQNQLLIQQDQVDVSLFVDQPEIKKVYAIKNPIYLKKLTLKLERDSINKNKYYITFSYDSLVDFDLYINFCVTKNKKNLKVKESPYIPAYLPNKNFEELSLEVKNLPRGENVSFLDKSAFIDLQNYSEILGGANMEGEFFDVCLEMVPILKEEEFGKMDNGNDIVVITLCKLITEENEAHNNILKPVSQRLKTQNLWIDLYDIFNSGMDSGECLICCNDLSNSIFLPCLHLCTCSNCAHSLRMRNNPCPICKQAIDDLLILENDDDKKETKKTVSNMIVSEDSSGAQIENSGEVEQRDEGY
ncbi:MAG: RING-HC finger protein [archaeon]|nr:RING-HC finger protein [archaeon]